MTMNLDRHMQAQKDMFMHLVRGDGNSADKHREFYDEYLAVMDLTAEFFLQTVDTVFVQHLMPRGLMTSRGRAVDLAAIRRPALMTVEGEKDDITGTGQCRAALDLCVGIPTDRKLHFECPRVGHYGVFNGSRFRSEIAPRMARFMRAHDPCAGAGAHHRAARAHGDDAASRPSPRISRRWPSASRRVTRAGLSRRLSLERHSATAPAWAIQLGPVRTTIIC